MRVVLDLETTSTVDLKKTGAQAYAEHPDTRVTVLCAAVDDGPVLTWRWDSTLTAVWKRFFEFRLRHGATFVAHNYLFEYNIWHHKMVPMGFPPIPIERWSCTMARSLVAGYPASLETAAKAARLSIQKDASARDLMLRMARPRTTEPTITWWHETSPEHFQRLCDYCAQDVEAERALDKVVPELSPRERRVFEADATINQRGIFVDIDLVTRLDSHAHAARALAVHTIIAATNAQVTTPNQVARIHAWLGGVGITLPDLRRATVFEALQSPTLVGPARRVLQARLDASRSSTAKLDAIRSARSEDGRVRGTFQYYGANRTGRAAGRRLQPQNLFRGSIRDVARAVKLIKTGCLTPDLEVLFEDSPMGVVASCLRSCITAPPGRKLAICDFAQIEARVLAWLAGETYALECFQRGDDIYTETAKAVGSSSRQMGKVLVLACIAEGEPVLTDQGLVPIECLTKDMRVWDGIAWVTHDGVVCQGEREIIEYDGLHATPDHLVWTEGHTDPVPFGDAASTLARLVRSGSGRTPLRYVGGDGPNIRPQQLWLSENTLPLHGMRYCAFDRLAQPEDRQEQRLSLSISQADLRRGMDGQGQSSHDRCTATLPEPQITGVGWVWRKRDYLRFPGRGRSDNLDHRASGSTGCPEAGDRSDQQRQRIRPGQSPLGYAQRAERQQTQKVRVYDILNAGPHRRFTVSDRLVHNCGFGMGAARFQATAAGFNLNLSLMEAGDAVDAWRRLNKRIVGFWWACDKAIMRVARSAPGTEIRVGRVVFKRSAKAVLIELPSGRHLVYRNPHVEQNEKTDKWEFTYRGSHGGDWVVQRAWPGKTVENITQAVARDVLVDKMIDLIDVHHLDLIAQVHDELVAECDDGDADQVFQLMSRCMSSTVTWAPTLPLAASGFVAQRYAKP